jgi:hypothetical protein
MISARSSPINHRYMKKESLSAEQEKIAAQSVSVAVHGGEMFFAGRPDPVPNGQFQRQVLHA